MIGLIAREVRSAVHLSYPGAFGVHFRSRTLRRTNQIVSRRRESPHRGVVELTDYPIPGAGVALTSTPTLLSFVGLSLALGGVVSTILTSWRIIVMETVHPPVYATTLVISLGLLSTSNQVGIIGVSVIILVECHGGVPLVFRRLVGDSHPLCRER